MKTACRWGAVTGLVAVAMVALASGRAVIAGVIGLGVLVHVALRARPRTMLYAAVPVLLFTMVLVALQWLGGTVDVRLPLRVVAIFAISTAAARLVPPPGLVHLRPGSRPRLPFLFLLFVRHFSSVLITEVKRTFQARALCIGSNFNRSGFQSLAWATAAVFRRSFDRAERFYAAQLIGGLDE